MYRGPGTQYLIRKTTVNNKTGDNYSITVPRIIAESFADTWFKILVSGGNIIFESGCKITKDECNKLAFDNECQRSNRGKKIYFQDTSVDFS